MKSNLLLMKRLIFCHLSIDMCTGRYMSYLFILIFLSIPYHLVREANFQYNSIFLFSKPVMKESPKECLRYQVKFFKMNLELVGMLLFT